jgi:hypothetical protein
MIAVEYPVWFSPLRMLCIFTGMSLIVYLDRGMSLCCFVSALPVTDELSQLLATAASNYDTRSLHCTIGNIIHNMCLSLAQLKPLWHGRGPNVTSIGSKSWMRGTSSVMLAVPKLKPAR